MFDQHDQRAGGETSVREPVLASWAKLLFSALTRSFIRISTSAKPSRPDRKKKAVHSFFWQTNLNGEDVFGGKKEGVFLDAIRCCVLLANG